VDDQDARHRQGPGRAGAALKTAPCGMAPPDAPWGQDGRSKLTPSRALPGSRKVESNDIRPALESKCASSTRWATAPEGSARRSVRGPRLIQWGRKVVSVASACTCRGRRGSEMS